jgi:hypothetical protein
MRYVRLLLLSLVLSLVFLIAQSRGGQPALAAQHVAEIHEVMSGFNGDPDVQYVEVNMRLSLQNVTTNAKLSAFDASGSFIDGDPMTIGDQPLLTVSGNVPNSGDGVRWLMGTTAFETAAGIQADFQFPASPGLPAEAGMVCVFENLRDFTNPAQSIDCVAYGGASFTGSNPNSSPSEAATSGPGDGQQSLTRINPAALNASPPWALSDDANDFALADPSPENNAGVTGTLAQQPVGGIAELPRLDGGQADVAGAPVATGESSGLSAGVLAGIIAGATAGAIALGGAAWHVRRRVAGR